MNKIKITYLVDFYRTINGGTENQIRFLLSNLPKEDYRIEMVSLQNSEFLKNKAAEMFPDVSFITLGAKPDISKSIRPLYNLFKYFRKSKPDVLQTFFPASNIFGVIIARFSGVKNIISSRRDMGFNLSKKDILMLKLANHFVTLVLSNSEAVMNRAIKFEGVPVSKSKVIYNGISLGKKKERKKKKERTKKIVGIVANLNRQVKRVDLFIKAVALVNKNEPEIEFWIIGDGKLKKDLEELARKLEISSKIFFLGRRNDVPELLLDIDVGVICSDSEGFSNSIMEYMLNSIPVVATKVGGNPELIDDGKTGILVEPDNPEALSNGILKCIQINEESKMVLDAKAKIVNSFSKEKMLIETQKLYNDMVK